MYYNQNVFTWFYYNRPPDTSTYYNQNAFYLFLQWPLRLLQQFSELLQGRQPAAAKPPPLYMLNILGNPCQNGGVSGCKVAERTGHPRWLHRAPALNHTVREHTHQKKKGFNVRLLVSGCKTALNAQGTRSAERTGHPPRSTPRAPAKPRAGTGRLSVGVSYRYAHEHEHEHEHGLGVIGWKKNAYSTSCMSCENERLVTKLFSALEHSSVQLGKEGRGEGKVG